VRRVLERDVARQGADGSAHQYQSTNLSKIVMDELIVSCRYKCVGSRATGDVHSVRIVQSFQWIFKFRNI
jgi:hypothetical protein